MLEDGLSYPTRGEWTGRLIIGSMFVVFGSVLLLPMMFVYGYCFRALRSTVAGEHRPPAWERWGDLAIDGLKSFLVSFAYLLVPNVLAGVVVFVLLAVVAGGEADAGTAGALAGIGIVGFLLVALVNLLVLFLLPAALVTFAAEDSASAAFSLGTVTGFAFSGEYVLALLQGLFVLLFASLVASTVILAPAALFWSGVALGRIFGTAYRSQMRSTSGGSAAPAPSGASRTATRGAAVAGGRQAAGRQAKGGRTSDGRSGAQRQQPGSGSSSQRQQSGSGTDRPSDRRQSSDGTAQQSGGASRQQSGGRGGSQSGESSGNRSQSGNAAGRSQQGGSRSGDSSRRTRSNSSSRRQQSGRSDGSTEGRSGASSRRRRETEDEDDES